MQYQFNERYEYVKTIEFLNSSPLLNVEKIRYFKEEEVTGAFTKREFRYSWDNIIWSNWDTLTQGNLSSIEFKDNPSFYLHIKYTRAGVGSGNIQRWYLFYDSNTPIPPIPPSDSSIDADTLGGELPEYYLNRENHFGPYTDLIADNVVDGSSAGVYYGRVDSSIGTELLFKRIDGSNGIRVIDDISTGKIIIDASGISGAGSSYANPDPVTQTVGGIDAGDDFFAGGKSFSETMQAMFFPTLYPTLTNPNNGFADNVGTIYEVGADLNITFTASFNRGSISPAFGTSGYRSGSPNTYYYTGEGLPPSVPETSLSDNQNLTGYEVSTGYQTWTSAVAYDAGEQPLDSIGDPYSTPLPAGTTSYKSVSFEGVYPLYATTSAITTPTKQSLVSMGISTSPGYWLVPESGGNKQKFQVPNKWTGAPTNNPLTGVQTWNSFASTWEYQGGSGTASLAYWTTSSVTQNIQGVIENYTQYTYNGTDRSTIQIRLIF